MSIQRYDMDYQSPGRDFRLLYISRSKCENDWHSLSHRLLSVSRARSTSECARIKQYMDDHFAETITLDTLAALSHMNKRYPASFFKNGEDRDPVFAC